jgi:EAL domain-containing protein (putative c-di-GMP-specific phosphodiesterase class I)
VDVITRALADTGFPARKLVLELTESVMLEPNRPVVARLEALRNMGIGLAVDDFGTGFSALSYLRQLPVNILKVDRSFVTGIGQDHDDEAIVATVITLAHLVGKTVVAEGVETAEQTEWLRQNRCDMAQGYRFGRPAPAADYHQAVAELPGRLPADVAF